MNGFILECLQPTGWHRSGEIYWRLIDAESAGRQLLKRHRIREARVLPVTVDLNAVTAITSKTSGRVSTK